MATKIKLIIVVIFSSVFLGVLPAVILLLPLAPNNNFFVSDNVVVWSPLPQETVQSPLTITGKARGTWYFEASFPVKIVDGRGVELGIVPATAQSDWMTTEFVPFKAVLEFKKPETKEGRLIFQKDNPSGLPEHDAEVSFPVIFSSYGEAEMVKVKAYFGNSRLDPEFSCNKVFPVERDVPKTQSIGRAALEEMLAGPEGNEKNDGFFTSINPGVKIQKLTIVNGVARVDFNDVLEASVGGSCRVSAIRAQITETLKQFSSVKQVIISINGRTEDILQP